ncbi:hypothetical protein B0J11DRAFT_276977 [Dendryphion nanum]|uniref:Uncharacterized protein n=1 Tax=Dendryphion nanum TaxID=256645 RepID=A0A9P9E114_9PLEO|nr:hypothetical protein B0J11DRAFT_276977 [Dendryphion nanum]
MTSSRRSTRQRTTKRSYAEVSEGDEDHTDDEVWRPVKSRRLVVIDSDDDLEVTPSLYANSATAGRKQEHASASARNTLSLNAASSRVARPSSTRRRPVIPDTDDELEEDALLSPARLVTPGREQEHASASAPNTLSLDVASSHIAGPSSRRRRPVVMDTDDEDEDESILLAEIAAELAAGIEDEEDSDEEDEFFPGPDYVPEDVLTDVPDNQGSSSVPSGTETQVNQEFAQKLRDLLEDMSKWAKAIEYREFMAMPEDDRPVTKSSWRLLRAIDIDFLLDLYLPGIPLEVQELFVKQEWTLADFLALQEIGEHNGEEPGLYANFPTGDLEHATSAGCEAYVGSTAVQILKRKMQHLAISLRHTVESLPKGHRRSKHYRTTCRDNVVCNFRKLAGFKRPIAHGYLILLESIFMVLLGTYNHPGYTAKWATQSSYELVRDIRAKLDLPTIPWKGLNAAWPLRQGFASSTRKSSECCNPACKTMTYPRFMMPDGPKHPRAIANSLDPLGGFLCRRCDSYRERRGVLPDNATLHKLVSNYLTETAKSEMRQAGQPVICENCGDVEAADGALNSAKGGGARHIASNGKIRCPACDTYLRACKKERDPALAAKKAILDRVKADRAAGIPIVCIYCGAIEERGAPRGRKRFAVVPEGGMQCKNCYQQMLRRSIR